MALERIVFHLTDRCQLDCTHCLRDPESRPNDLEIEILESTLDQARELFGANHAGLTGGEPTLHPEFYRVVDAIADRGLSWHMVSNGWQFERVAQRLAERPERLKKLTNMNFSLEGAAEATNDAIRGPGSYQQVLKAASVCCARDIPFTLQMTLNSLNVAEIEQMALLASELGAMPVS